MMAPSNMDSLNTLINALEQLGARLCNFLPTIEYAVTLHLDKKLDRFEEFSLEFILKHMLDDILTYMSESPLHYSISGNDPIDILTRYSRQNGTQPYRTAEGNGLSDTVRTQGYIPGPLHAHIQHRKHNVLY